MSDNLKEIVFDTETTGLSYDNDRVIEIGCVELLNHIPTGRTYHIYINPEREVPADAIKIHGITNEFLADKPKFAEIADDFIKFIDDATLIAHNAKFDISMLNAEFRRLNLPELEWDRVIDTLKLSHQVNPHMSRHNLDTLCRHYGIDNSRRNLHGALLDAQLLAEVYLELIGGKEIDFFKKSVIDEDNDEKETKREEVVIQIDDTPKTYHPARNIGCASKEELELHNSFVSSMKTDVDKATKQANPIIWKYADN